jgi:hypothetical protein
MKKRANAIKLFVIGNPYWKGRLNKVDHHKAADLNLLVEGGEPY